MTLKQRCVVAAVVSVACFTGVALRDAAGGMHSGVSKLRENPALAWHVLAIDCSVQCYDNEENVKHYAPPVDTSVATHQENEGDHVSAYDGLCTEEWCDPDSCSEPPCECEEPNPGKHPACGGGHHIAKADIQDALRRGDMAALRAVLTTHSAVAAFVPDRSAIQIMACRGDVFAHFRLAADEAVALQL